jgi:response regulator RpfG family c-di-GMP phosphodiesterase
MVAVNDAILKKSSALSYEEKVELRNHTILGVRLFTPQRTPSC